jgi:hypothetical protein
VWIPAHQQHLQLMGLKFLDRTVGRPTWKTAAGQSLVTNPKALSVVSQNLYRRTPPVAEHKQPAAKRISAELRPAHPRQTIDAGAKINARDSYQDAHLRRQLNHAPPQPERHSCNTTSAAAPDAISTDNLCPPTPCSVSLHSPRFLGSVPVNSMNFADLCTAGILLRTATPEDTPLARLSLLYSSPNARAVA